MIFQNYNNSDFRRPTSVLKIINKIYILSDDYLPGIWTLDIRGGGMRFFSLSLYNIYQPSCMAIYNNRLLIYDAKTFKINILNHKMELEHSFAIENSNCQLNSMCFNESDNILYCTDLNNSSLVSINMSNYRIDYIQVVDDGLKQPSWITTFNCNELYIADSGNNRIIYYNLKNKKNKIYLQYGQSGKGCVRYPTCVVISELYLYVFDNKNYLIQIFDKKNFTFIEQIGGKGSSTLQFDLPTSGCMINNQLYIADRNNDRISVYDELQKTLTELVSPSFFPGRLRRPVRVATDSEDTIFIADRDNNCIQIFDNKNLHKNIITKTKDEFLISQPSSVGIIENGNTKNLLISMRGLNNTDLQLINMRSLKRKSIKLSIKDSQDMATNKNGSIIIADTMNRKILLVMKEGEDVRELDVASISGNNRILVKGVCFAKNNTFMYADYDECKIYIHQFNNEKLVSIINLANYKNELRQIKSITATSKSIIICNRGNSPIWLIDYNGKIINKIGKKGKGDYSFRNPSNIIEMNCGDFLVVDKENDRIVRFTKNFSYKLSIGNQYNCL